MSEHSYRVNVRQIKEWQTEKGWNDSELAKKSNCNASTIARMFQNGRASMVIIRGVASALGKEVKDLLELPVPEPRNDKIGAISPEWRSIEAYLEEKRQSNPSRGIYPRDIAAATGMSEHLARQVCNSWCQEGKMRRSEEEQGIYGFYNDGLS
jgi:transcriptional regulator with XRE-family HTH domain